MPQIPTENGSPDPEKELLALREELAQLRKEKETLLARREFAALFPGCDPEVLPPDVQADVERGIPLTAAYALHLRKLEVEKEQARQQSLLAGARSAGGIHGSSGEEDFSLQEISAMSQSEIRRHYDGVIRSLGNYGKSRKKFI